MKKHYVFLSMLLFSFAYVDSQTYYAFINLFNQEKIRKDEIHGYINNFGKITYKEKEGETIYPLSEGLGVLKKQGKHGFIDPNGNIIIPLMYDNAESFSEGLAAVKMNGKWGYINKKNEWVIKPTLIYNGSFINKVAYYIDETAMKNNLYKFIDTSGKYINNEFYVDAQVFSDSCAWVKDKKTKDWGCINTKGEYIIQPKYANARFFNNGRSWVQSKNKWGCVNKKGEYIVEQIYEGINTEANGYMWVQKMGNWGLLDSTGKMIIPVNYKNEVTYKLKSDFAYSYSTIHFGVGFGLMGPTMGIFPETKQTYFSIPAYGLMPFNVATKYGYCNLNLKPVIEAQFDDATNFIDGVAAVKLKKRWGLIDTTGKLICDYKYKNITYLGHNLYSSEEDNNRIIIFDKTGTLICAEDFIKVKCFE